MLLKSLIIQGGFLLSLLAMNTNVCAQPVSTIYSNVFGEPRLLNSNSFNSTGDDGATRLATDGNGNWVHVWRSDDPLNGTLGTDNDILVSRSSDDGHTWSAARAVNSYATNDKNVNDTDPDLVTDQNGTWIVAWQSSGGDPLGYGSDRDIHYAISTDNGATWTDSALLNSNGIDDDAIDAGVSLATDGFGNWVAAWGSNDDLNGSIGADADILFSFSNNNGASWSAVFPLNSDASQDIEITTSVKVATDGRNNWVAVWVSEKPQGGPYGDDQEIFYSTSNNQGQSWSAASVLNTTGREDEGDDRVPQLVTDGLGNWAAIWESDRSVRIFNHIYTSVCDVYVSLAIDDRGSSWGAPVKLNNYGEGDLGASIKPRLAIDTMGNWVAIWNYVPFTFNPPFYPPFFRRSSSQTSRDTTRDEYRAYITQSADFGTTWSTPRFIQVEDPDTLSGTILEGFNYNIITDQLGNWLLTWDSCEDLNDTIGRDSDILFSRSTDNGTSWTERRALNPNAFVDGGDNLAHDLATDGNGTWMSVWRTEDSFGGTIGSDADIVFARSTNNGLSWEDVSDFGNHGTFNSSTLDSIPVIKSGGNGVWLAAWSSGDSLGDTIGRDWDIVFTRTTDNGTSWSVVAPLNTNATGDSGTDWKIDLETDGQGNWLAVWDSEDTLNGMEEDDWDIFLARSDDNGETWSSPFVLTDNELLNEDDDNLPVIESSTRGTTLVVWQSVSLPSLPLGSDWDLLFARSEDFGMSWSQPMPLNSNALNGLYSDSGASLATDDKGNWVVVWQSSETLENTVGTDLDIFFSRSTDDGRTWSPVAPLHTDAVDDERSDRGPRLLTNGEGNWVVVWNATGFAQSDLPNGRDNDLFISVSHDLGASWSPPQLLNPDALTDSSSDSDYTIKIARGKDGRWMVVWTIWRPYDELLGSDRNLVYMVGYPFDDLDTESFLLY